MVWYNIFFMEWFYVFLSFLSFKSTGKRTVFTTTRSQFMVKSCSSPSPRVQYATSRKCKGNIHKAYSLRMMHTPHAPPCAPPPWKPRDAHLFLYKCARPKSVEGTVSETTMKVRINRRLKNTLGQNPSIYPKIHISLFTKFTFLKSHFSQNSHFQYFIFHKIHNFKITFFSKFTISKSHFSHNSHFLNIKFLATSYG